MNPNDPNASLIVAVANALGELRSELVFVGGCATGLLITDQGRPPVRPTTDVDLITEIASHTEFYRLSERLRGAGFKESTELICRWQLGALTVDVMPTREEILGFSNRWYSEAIDTSLIFELRPALEIRLINPPMLLATKLEAFYGRGRGDYRMSHDIEDIVTLIDGRPEIIEEVRNSSLGLQEYLAEEFEGLIGEMAFVDALPGFFHTDDASQARVSIAIERIRRLAGL